MGQEESDLVCYSLNQADTDHQGAVCEDSEGAVPQDFTFFGGEAASSPSNLLSRRLEAGRPSVISCPEMAGHREEKTPKKGSTKSMRTGMSRRRVSCRELGRADCDGWLWKKKKDSGVFVAQKWQRFWFVLKGSSLYWYTSQQEEKADGLLKISSYSIESAGEHKRKYVFKMYHDRFQNFFFAADNINDMSKWVKCLITAIQKYRKSDKGPPDSEEECCSETEPEDEGSPRSPRNTNTTLSHTLPRTKGRKNKVTVENSLVSPTTGGNRQSGHSEDEMGVLFQRLRKDGVSPIGNEQPITHDQFRKSFIRRNKNPVINEKVHTLRALQSTLKAKEVELQLINKLLEDPSMTSLKFRQWKEGNEHLLQEIERLAAERGQGSGGPHTGGRTDVVTVEMGATGDNAQELSLSDGEQLVDAEVSDPTDTAGSNGQNQNQNQDLDLSSAAADSYFFI